MAFNNLRIKFNMLMKKMLSPRKAQTKFVNPYAMSEATTPQYRVKPEFRDGRFVLKKEESMFETKKKEDGNDEGVTASTPPAPVKVKEPGLLKYFVDVVITDVEKISGETKRKQRSKVAKEQSSIVEKFIKTTKRRKAEPLLKQEEAIVNVPPAFELELIEPVKPVEPIPSEHTEYQPMKCVPLTGNEILVASTKRTLDHMRTFEPSHGVKK
jgi:hypothetical protein